jgi:predicted nucleotidyltransferase
MKRVIGWPFRAADSLGRSPETTPVPRSDVDMLVDFEGITSFDGYMDVKDLLERVLERRVDLVPVPKMRVVHVSRARPRHRSRCR